MIFKNLHMTKKVFSAALIGTLAISSLPGVAFASDSGTVVKSGSARAGAVTVQAKAVNPINLLAPSATTDTSEKEEDDTDEIEIKEVSYKRYVTTSLNVRKAPTMDSKVIDVLNVSDKVKVTGEVKDSSFVQIKHDGKTVYASSKYMSKKQPQKKKDSTVSSSSWNGPKLTRSAGTVTGPSGKETYYNLPMQGVVSIMRRQGYDYKYWVREDGVKCLGPYVMVAANLSLRPRGSLVPTSLGMGIVADTGGFAASNPTQLDIATAW